MSIKMQAKRWMPIVILSLVVVSMVWWAYRNSSNWAVEPLDGLRTAGSLILTVFLLYIYQRQNEILMKQQEIMESEEEIQEAAHVSPRIETVWGFSDSQRIELNIQNVGAGDAYDVQLATRMEILNRECEYGITPQKYTTNITPRLVPDQELDTKESLLFRFTKNGRERTESFLEISQIIWSTMNEKGVNEQQIKINLEITCKDSRNEEFVSTIAESVVNLNKPGIISKKDSSDVTIASMSPPQLSVIQWKILPGEMIGLKLKNDGRMAAHNIKIYSEISIYDGDDWVNSEKYLKGTDLSFQGSRLEIDESSMGESKRKIETISLEEELMARIRFKIEDNSRANFQDFTEYLSKTSFSNPVSIGIRIEYDDGVSYDAPSLNINIIKFSSSKGDEYMNIKQPVRLRDILKEIDDTHVV